jgi:hypothetical protein
MGNQRRSFYGVEDFRDLYNKSLDDWKQLANSDPKKKSYALFNLVMTLNHLFDWFLKDPGVSQRRKLRCIQAFNPYKKKASPDLKRLFEKLPTFPQKNINQYLVRCVCNKAKHAKLTPALSRSEVTAFIGTGDPRAFAGSPVAVAGYHVTTTSYEVKDGNKKYNLQTICEDLRAQWGEFIKREGLLFRK